MFPHESKIVRIGQNANRYLHPNSFWLCDLEQDAILEGLGLISLAELGDGDAVSESLTDNGYHQRGLVDNAALALPTSDRVRDGVARWEELGSGGQSKSSAFVDRQLRGLEAEGDGVGGRVGHGVGW